MTFRTPTIVRTVPTLIARVTYLPAVAASDSHWTQANVCEPNKVKLLKKGQVMDNGFEEPPLRSQYVANHLDDANDDNDDDGNDDDM